MGRVCRQNRIHWRLRLRATVLLLAAALSAPCPSADVADEGNEASATSQSWIDRSHRYVTHRLATSAEWFDQFFSDERAEAEERAGMVVRWRNGIQTSEDQTLDFSSRIRANVSLPKINRRLRLIIQREDEPDPTEVLPRDPIDPGDDGTTVGLRYDLPRTTRSSFSLGASFSPGVTARYRYALPLSPMRLVRFVETGFWENDEGWGQRTRIDLEHWFTPGTYLRFSNAGTWSESSNGIDWGSELSWFSRVSARTAIRVDLGASGHTDPSFRTEEYLARFRFRRNFHRPWLFYELEPEMRWPLGDDRKRRDVFGVTLRLEILFRQL